MADHDGKGDPRDGLVVPKALKAWLARHSVAPQHLTTYSDPTTGRTMDPMRDSGATRGIVRHLVGMLWSAPESPSQPDAEPVEGEAYGEVVYDDEGEIPLVELGGNYCPWPEGTKVVVRARVQQEPEGDGWEIQHETVNELTDVHKVDRDTVLVLARVVRDRLRARVQPRRVGDWRPMKEAPRDRKDVLVRVRPDAPLSEGWSHLAGQCFVGRHIDGSGWSLFPGFGGIPGEWLAGWMPLPALPETVPEGGNDA